VASYWRPQMVSYPKSQLCVQLLFATYYLLLVFKNSDLYALEIGWVVTSTIKACGAVLALE
jgi:hypothetical protein